MSAYGKVSTPSISTRVTPRLYPLPERVRQNTSDPRCSILFLPFGPGGLENTPLPRPARELLHSIFNTELARGVTYPQRGPMTFEEFEGYFLSSDAILGIFQPSLSAYPSISSNGLEVSLSSIPNLDLSTLNWEESLACFYYVKPNYPGRSSHLCNGGFVVPEHNRGLGLGGVAGRSFLHYAPGLGYKGSVFNLVYENNKASLAIWQRLGFTQVGKIPKAGLLKTTPGGDEEKYYDAWVIYCDFEERKRVEEAAKKEIA